MCPIAMAYLCQPRKGKKFSHCSWLSVEELILKDLSDHLSEFEWSFEYWPFYNLMNPKTVCGIFISDKMLTLMPRSLRPSLSWGSQGYWLGQQSSGASLYLESQHRIQHPLCPCFSDPSSLWVIVRHSDRQQTVGSSSIFVLLPLHCESLLLLLLHAS